MQMLSVGLQSVWLGCVVCGRSSVGNLAFWLSLSGCVGRQRCQELLGDFTAQEAKDKASFEQFCHSYNQDLATKVGWS